MVIKQTDTDTQTRVPLFTHIYMYIDQQCGLGELLAVQDRFSCFLGLIEENRHLGGLINGLELQLKKWS